MKSVRKKLIVELKEYLVKVYDGPISLVKQQDSAELELPYAVIRVGSSEDMGGGQVFMWDMNVFLAVFHDAEGLDVEEMEKELNDLVEYLLDVDVLKEELEPLVISAFEYQTQEASIVDGVFQNVFGFRVIVSPPSEEN